MRRVVASSPKQLAEACGVDVDTIYLWRRLANWPGAGQREWDAETVEAIRVWAKARKRTAAVTNARRPKGNRASPRPKAEQEEAPAAPKQGQFYTDPLLQADLELKRASTALKEQELARRRGELVERVEVDDMLATRARAFARELRALGRKLARRLVNMADAIDVQTIIEAAHDNALRHWSAER